MITVVVHLVVELFIGSKAATILALVAALISYGITLILLGGLTEEEMLQMPKGAAIVTVCRKLHLIRGEYR